MDIHACIAKRRDTRHFLADSVPNEVLDQAFLAAHQAPSVGLSEPWRFVRISSREKLSALHVAYSQMRNAMGPKITDPVKQKVFSGLKLEALLEAPIVIGVFCERPPDGAFTIGIQGSIDAVEWSCACAVQNFWLSLTAQGFGAGWVSIIDLRLISSILQTPDTWRPMGLLCVGRPATDYNGIPMLEKEHWRRRSAKPVVIEI